MNKPVPSDAEAPWIVLVNNQGEHSLWPASSPMPAGWREVGPEGTQQACAAWVDRHWVALQPAVAKP
ncbi:MbtH family NRPS accessory protein [Sphaerotilus sp.]|uniref:MbtH family NRPS accessory protein n=1 Tax=Sphaerotilus sp. TaxID=2093942 RepID=UPI002ACDD598|nr:MbtH family NRPS accessory protein [Sphaerotilus sp.]MDZ7857509.1 MbtH family NRPS accessory protein [Sphaerotilus sp.]